MSYSGYITRIKDLRKHSNADRLLVGSCFGNSVIVDLDTSEGDLGAYFPTDGRLGVEFCKENKLLREKDANGNNIEGYLDPERRNIISLKLRGEKSDGLFLSIKCLEKFCDISTLKEGNLITVLNGVTICEKYIPINRNKNIHNQGNKLKIPKTKPKESFPFFEEHVDTSQLAYNKGQFKEGDTCYITLKMHGASQRTALSIKEQEKKIPIIHRVSRLLGVKPKIKRSWEYVTGTRRVALKDFEGGFYGDNQFRRKWHDYFIGKLRKGITVYYEVVGYTHDSQTIMPECSNAKTKDKEFIKQYGKVTRFTYGCEEGQNDIYVYRMTMTNEDGDVIEIPWETVKIYCEQMGVKHVPELDKFIFTSIEDLMERVNTYIDGADPVGKSHVREGIVVRIDNREKFKAFKHKNFYFKVLEGLIKSEDILDMEEAESLEEESVG